MNHLDFLEALDRHTRASPSGEVATGYEMHQIAWSRRVASHPSVSAASWTGQLVDLGYVEPGPALGGASRKIPPQVGWTDQELQSFSGYRITASGRQEAERVRRARRDDLTDAALGQHFLRNAEAILNEHSASAFGRSLRDLRSALDEDRPAAAIGAAKDLVEAACKSVLAAAGVTPGTRSSLPSLYGDALRELPHDRVDLGRSLSATVQRLAELRNRVGAGHGHADPIEVSAAEARLARGCCSCGQQLSARAERRARIGGSGDAGRHQLGFKPDVVFRRHVVYQAELRATTPRKRNERSGTRCDEQ